LTFQSEASAEHYDIAVSDPDGDNLVLLTSIGAESVSNRQPRWRPPGAYEKMIAYTSNLEMTRTERGMKRNDVWIARPDGSDRRNLTQATSPSTEEQLNNDIILWSWDGRWILSRGDRFDSQAKDIHTVYLMDPVNGGYKTIFTTFPRKDGLHERVHVIKWSYDSTNILMYTQRYDVKNWDTEREYQRTRHVLSLLHVDTGRRDEILLYDEELERKEILGSDRGEIEDITFSPDGRSILLSMATIVSREDGISRPDVYRLDLPDSLVGPEASKHIGPPVGRSAVSVSDQGASLAKETPDRQARVVPAAVESTPVLGDNVITEIIRPLHMTADEALESLSPEFTQYMTKNVSRNLLLFKGPPEVLDEIRQDLTKIDTPAPQILVDLLAVELSDEANRSLGLDWTYAKGRLAFFQPVGNAVRDLTPDSAALVQDEKGTILANPRTVAMSGRESRIKVLKTLNYFFNEGFDVAGRPVVKKSDISSNTEGRITPTLLANGKIHMLVDVMVGSFTFTPDSGLPEQTQRDSTTEVVVSEGDTLVIGGLRQQEMVQTVSKVPFLGDLPILGWLFKQEQKEVKQSVLTLFITPHVLREGQPAPSWPEVDLENGHRIPSSDPNGMRL